MIRVFAYFDDWPRRWNDEIQDGEVDDPLGPQEDGWVWVGLDFEQGNLLSEIIIDFKRAVGSNIKIVATHPFVSTNDVFELMSDQSDDKAAVYYKSYQKWTSEIISTIVHTVEPGDFPSNMLHAAASFNLHSSVGDIMLHGGDVNTCNDGFYKPCRGDPISGQS